MFNTKEHKANFQRNNENMKQIRDHKLRTKAKNDETK